MNLKASVAPQPAFGHPLLAPLVSTHTSVTQVSPLAKGGKFFAPIEVCAETNSPHSGARGLFVVVPKALFLWLDETQAVCVVWDPLVASIPVMGKNAHDARFAAAMTVHGLTHLLTLDSQDFRQYPGMTVMTPLDVLTR
jgi:predicted nucleic acid-binding protein